MNWAISTLAYSTAVTRQVKIRTIKPATRNRGRTRRASNVLDGSKKMPVRVSPVDISGPVGADALGGAIGSLIGILLRINGTGEKAVRPK
jgi:hypothetical protein